ncbi:MAG: hypothetical protein GY866_30200 [Proteobacteria bacterium]|nr:hypothetical protein [Pseudomonadota bacterium]
MESGDRKTKNGKPGYILPFSVILAAILLAMLGLWYRQVVLQSYLAERLLQQRALYIECRSLVPILIDELDKLDVDELIQKQEDFFKVKGTDRLRWKIDRSKWIDDKIRFTFKLRDQSIDSLNLTIHYTRE